MKQKLPIVFRVNQLQPNFKNIISKFEKGDFLTQFADPTKFMDLPENQNQGRMDLTAEDLKLITLSKIKWLESEYVWEVNLNRM